MFGSEYGRSTVFGGIDSIEGYVLDASGRVWASFPTCETMILAVSASPLLVERCLVWTTQVCANRVEEE